MWRARQPWTLVLGLALIAFLAWQLAPQPLGSRAESKSRINSELLVVRDAILAYAADWNDRIPAVDSDSLPPWWLEYSKSGRIRGVRFQTADSAIGKKPAALSPNEALLIASGPGVDQVWERAGTRLWFSVDGGGKEAFVAE